jgi:hypothetical protein
VKLSVQVGNNGSSGCHGAQGIGIVGHVDSDIPHIYLVSIVDDFKRDIA